MQDITTFFSRNRYWMYAGGFVIQVLLLLLWSSTVVFAAGAGLWGLLLRAAIHDYRVEKKRRDGMKKGHCDTPTVH